MEGIIIGIALLAGAVAAPVALALVLPAIGLALLAQLAGIEAGRARWPATRKTDASAVSGAPAVGGHGGVRAAIAA